MILIGLLEIDWAAAGGDASPTHAKTAAAMAALTRPRFIQSSRPQVLRQVATLSPF
jgi:hypothetical protein